MMRLFVSVPVLLEWHSLTDSGGIIIINNKFMCNHLINMDVNWNVNLPSLWLTYLIALRKDTFTEHLLYSSSSHGGWEGYISNRVDSVIQNSSIRHSQKNFADHLGVPVA